MRAQVQNENKSLRVRAGDNKGDQLEEPFRLRLLKRNFDVRMVRLALRLGTSGNILEPLVAIVLLFNAPAPVRALRRLVSVLVHLPAAHEPSTLAHEPACLARADEQVGERASARGLDVHHALDARPRLSRQEAEDRFAGRQTGRR